MENTAMRKPCHCDSCCWRIIAVWQPQNNCSFIKELNLLRHSVDAALETGCQYVYVVLGANMDLMKDALKDKPVILVENNEWKEGMASSIRCGVEKSNEHNTRTG